MNNNNELLEVNISHPPILFWCYENCLAEHDCDKIISVYTDKNNPDIKTEPPLLGSGKVIHEIRSVERILLPTHKGLGALMSGIGLDANQAMWNFDIKACNQCEFLKYTADIEGKYTTHVDMIINPREPVCRKLTVLLFLNDDFEGGRFYLQDENERKYVPQRKGTVLVFPSFIPHGVEVVTKGTRYSVVAWMVGPWLK